MLPVSNSPQVLEEDDRDARVTLLKNLLSGAEDQAKVAKFVDELLEQVDDFMSKFGSTLRSSCTTLNKAINPLPSTDHAHLLPRSLLTACQNAKIARVGAALAGFARDPL